MYAIETQHVGKTYRNGREALKDITIQVKQGEIFCLLGENGAGKSTLINILSTFFSASKGQIKLFGQTLTEKNISSIRRQIATVSQQVSVDTYLSLKENMLFQAELYGIPKATAHQRMEQLITSFELQKYLDYPVASFSGGIKRRLDIALNLMSNPKILFLDEPTVGMDVQSRQEMWKMITQIKEKMATTIFLTTHYLEEAEQLSDTICIMKEGRTLVQGSTTTIRNYFHENVIEFKFSSPSEAKANFSVFQATDYTVTLTEEKILISNQKDDGLAVFMQWLLDNQVKLQGVSIVYPTLEDVFVRIIAKEETS